MDRTAAASVRAMWAALLALALAACSLSPTASETLVGMPGLMPVVQHYYEARATEENGRCRTPQLDGVLNATITERDGQRTVIQMRYLYRDQTAELRGACIGFGNRSFTIEQGPDGPSVVDMTGGQHPRGLRLRLAS